VRAVNIRVIFDESRASVMSPGYPRLLPYYFAASRRSDADL
jgi:hypothetical protein